MLKGCEERGGGERESGKPERGGRTRFFARSRRKGTSVAAKESTTTTRRRKKVEARGIQEDRVFQKIEIPLPSTSAARKGKEREMGTTRARGIKHR